MPKNLQALFKLFLRLFFFTALFAAGLGLHAQEILWYRSNSSSMLLERLPSQSQAILHEYYLSVRRVFPRELPELLRPHYNPAFFIELHTLFEEGEEYRRQWVFRDYTGAVRLTASGRGGLFDEEITEGEARTGFIEVRDIAGAIIWERRFYEDLSEWEFRFNYRNNVLLSVESWYKEPPVPITIEGNEEIEDGEETEEDYENSQEAEPASATQVIVIMTEPVFVPAATDHYRYSRFGSLRAIDRVIHRGAGEFFRLSFPRLGPDIFPDRNITVAGIAYTPQFVTPAFSDEIHISYTLDARARVLNEVWRDEEGNILGEIRYTWSGDRLQTVLWKSSNEERLVEYEYNEKGDRIEERNYRQGVLERRVIIQGNRETEEVFMDGRLILRAFWEDGLRVSEERISPGRGRP